MKKELDSNIYKTTLDFLDDRIAIYKQMYEVSKTADIKARHEQLITDCENVKKVFRGSFVPRKKRARKEQANE